MHQHLYMWRRRASGKMAGSTGKTGCACARDGPSGMNVGTSQENLRWPLAGPGPHQNTLDSLTHGNGQLFFYVVLQSQYSRRSYQVTLLGLGGHPSARSCASTELCPPLANNLRATVEVILV